MKPECTFCPEAAIFEVKTGPAGSTCAESAYYLYRYYASEQVVT